MESTGSSQPCKSQELFFSQAATSAQSENKQQLWSLLEANQTYLKADTAYQAQELQTLDKALKLLKPDAEAGTGQAKLLAKVSRVVDASRTAEVFAVDVDTVNGAADVPLLDHGFEELRSVADFVKAHGADLTVLNLSGFEVNDSQLAALVKKCPKLQSLTIDSSEFTGAALTQLAGTPIKELRLIGCEAVTDEACQALADLELELLDCRYCSGLGDTTLAHLKDMPLRAIAFHGCYLITDEGIKTLAGKQLKHVDFGLCGQITDEGLQAFAGMQLESINFNSCMELTVKGIQVFKGMPLEEINLYSCVDINEEHIAALLQRD